MNRILFLAAALIAASNPSAKAGIIVEWRIEDGGNGHFYEFVSEHVLWAEAYADASSRSFMGLPGHLATVTSLEENAFVAKLTTGGYTWIGLTDSEAFGGMESMGQPNSKVDGWVWVTGEPVVFTNWRREDPSDTNNNEDFALLNADGKHLLGISFWNDGDDNNPSEYLVEYEAPIAPVPEPASFAVWSGAILAGLAAAGRRSSRHGLRCVSLR